MRIFLIRHGQSIANIEKNPKGIPDPEIHLTDRGEEQANRCGIFLANYIKENNISLDNTRMWYSPFMRTTQTAEIINGHLGFDKRHFYPDDNLVEQLYGLFDGRPYEEWKNIDPAAFKHYDKYYNWKNKFFVKFPMGESPFDVEQRIQLFFETIHRDLKEDGVDQLFIVTHGTTLRIFVKRWMHYHYKWFENEKNPGNCFVRLIEDNKDKGYIYKGRQKGKIIVPEQDKIEVVRAFDGISKNKGLQKDF